MVREATRTGGALVLRVAARVFASSSDIGLGNEEAFGRGSGLGMYRFGSDIEVILFPRGGCRGVGPDLVCTHPQYSRDR